MGYFNGQSTVETACLISLERSTLDAVRNHAIEIAMQWRNTENAEVPPRILTFAEIDRIAATGQAVKVRAESFRAAALAPQKDDYAAVLEHFQVSGPGVSRH